jgi:hypothetical protein
MYSQGLTTDPYTEPGEASTCVSLRSVLILSLYPRVGLPKWSLPFRFCDKHSVWISHLFLTRYFLIVDPIENASTITRFILKEVCRPFRRDSKRIFCEYEAGFAPTVQLAR